ncbi:hypothetical protein DIU31_016615 [Mucilaginibacter rubeus]|uniref:Uncharacterized protein n=1 Tax=Mucilaginibacter rubeus TaxID=2027860 RepID=A0AAE6JGK5_9SPHI|nr:MULTISPECIES: effector-associated domain EAD1-containing protein [Mucilaginibacter]QEM05056.1 hypothetical protein DIU31_016615 [Mucilaginibacter rubeus]QEM17650.1 hypothetical protein DIU38_016785 [Mucilaginibacter gossypii]QTE45827.1 hypothetical protein J3L19_10905 [Mucilaginibacter rubeus]QTE52424.1 hypothetical protein J3L21_10880 [Mucilaginibacter rubeus]QTE57512.1 hypothetical protein J3L23_02550 [Mucilaginibacter rubeus]
MKILIHQSLCGEKGGAWDLLKTTIKDQKIAQAIAFKTDLHDTASGKSWGPAVRGFCYDEYFLVIKSFVDPSTTVRPGRAFSHVLILEKKNLSHVDNLTPLFDLLPNEVNKNATIETITIDISKVKKRPQNVDLPEPFFGRFKKVITGYVNYSEWFNTIVWVGENDYNKAVAELWERLTDEEKEKFNFDIYFNANAVPKSTLNLINVPEKTVSKFQNSGFMVVGEHDSAVLSSISEQILVGHKESHTLINNFAEAIGADVFPRSEWDTVSIVLSTFENYKQETDFKKLSTLSHIIASYSPSPKKGAAFKEAFVKHLAKLIDNSDYQDFGILQNFKTESFAKSVYIFGESIAKWLKKRLFQLNAATIESLKIIELLKGTKNKDWLSQSVDESLKAFFHSPGMLKAQIFYEWLSINPKLLELLQLMLINIKEEDFIQALPLNLKQQLVDALKIYAAKTGLLVFYAHLLIKDKGIEEALTELLAIDKNQNSTRGLEVILAKTEGETAVNCAVNLKDRRLILIAGKYCRATPALLSKIDVSNTGWQDIWAESIRLGNSVEKGIKKFNLVLDQLFTLLINGEKVKVELISSIANSKYGNILYYDRRNELWGKLDDKNRSQFLKETSAYLLSELSNGKNINVPNDSILSNYIFDYAISDFLYFNKDKIKPVIPIFKKFTNIPNHYLEEYLKQFRGILGGNEAKQLGKLIYQRKSGSSAHLVYNRSSKNNSWSIALKECYDLLSLVDKGKIFLSGLIPKVKIGKEQWWTNTEELLCNYYPNPVSLTRVWERAGGHESDLVLGVPARETWAKAIKKLKNKEFKKISMNSLMKEVNDEFSYVDDFNFLFKIRKDYI